MRRSLRAAALLALCAYVAAASTARRGPLLVVGSVNLDVTAHLQRLPAPGETVTALRASPSLAQGGKGANQAVAAARLVRGTGRAPPRFAGRLGDDAHAAWLQAQLAADDVDAACSGAPAGTASGQGLVLLDAQGAATSVVLGGANAEGWPADDAALRAEAEALVAGTGAGAKAALLMLQREVPERVNAAMAAAAAREGLPVLLDAGGEATPPGAALLAHVDFFMPNESELERLTGMPAGDNAAALAAARALLARWVAEADAGVLGAKKKARHVLVTLGERGALLLRRDSTGGETVTWQGPAPLPGGVVVDATAAGDAFRAAFAVALAEGAPADSALGFAAAAGAIAASRHGAAPSLPTRREVDALALQAPQASLPEACSAVIDAAPPPVSPPKRAPATKTADGDAFPLQFASRLNSMRSRRDLITASAAADNVLGWVARQGGVAGLSAVYFNFPQHLSGLMPSDVRSALNAAGLSAAGIAMRFPEVPFMRGAFSAPDAATRAAAVALAAEGCSWSAALGGDELVVWSPYDGYDYHLAANYTTAWADTVAAFRQLTDACPPGVRVSVEWKPSDPAARFAFVPTTAAAVLLARAVDRPGRFGVTLDVGHALLAGENPAQSAALAADHGVLFGVQLGDAHSRLGAEDGLAFATVHEAASLELVHWLRRVNYGGRLYFDTFPAREDPVAEAELNIRRVKALWSRSERLQEAGVEEAMARQDAMQSLLVLERTP
jgi:ribokinase